MIMLFMWLSVSIRQIYGIYESERVGTLKACQASDWVCRVVVYFSIRYS